MKSYRTESAKRPRGATLLAVVALAGLLAACQTTGSAVTSAKSGNCASAHNYCDQGK